MHEVRWLAHVDMIKRAEAKQNKKTHEMLCNDAGNVHRLFAPFGVHTHMGLFSFHMYI